MSFDDVFEVVWDHGTYCHQQPPETIRPLGLFSSDTTIITQCWEALNAVLLCSGMPEVR